MRQRSSLDSGDDEANKLQIAILCAPSVYAHDGPAARDLAYLLTFVLVALVVDDGVRPIFVLEARVAEQDTVVHRIRQDPPDGLTPDICSRNLGAS